MTNPVLKKKKEGKTSLGTFTHLRSITAIEALGATGLDFVVIDTEHSPVAASEMADYVAAADAAGIAPFVRIDSISREAVLHALDVGACGIIVPSVESVDEVRRLVEYAKFAPIGRRGYCPTRDGRWGTADSYSQGMSSYMRRANEEALLIPQCETLGCLEHIEEIVAIDGVDGIMIGPFDLSIAMGMPGEFDDPRFVAAVSRVLEAVKACDKLSVFFTGDAACAGQKISQGFSSVILGLDISFLIDKYHELLTDIAR